MPDNVTPLHTQLLIRRESREKSDGGIVLPDSVKPTANIGRIVAIGEYAHDEHQYQIGMLVVWVGDQGIWSNSPPPVEVEHDGKPHVLVHYDRVIATVDRS